MLKEIDYLIEYLKLRDNNEILSEPLLEINVTQDDRILSQDLYHQSQEQMMPRVSSQELTMGNIYPAVDMQTRPISTYLSPNLSKRPTTWCNSDAWT